MKKTRDEKNRPVIVIHSNITTPVMFNSIGLFTFVNPDSNEQRMEMKRRFDNETCVQSAIRRAEQQMPESSFFVLNDPTPHDESLCHLNDPVIILENTKMHSDSFTTDMSSCLHLINSSATIEMFKTCQPLTPQIPQSVKMNGVRCDGGELRITNFSHHETPIPTDELWIDGNQKCAVSIDGKNIDAPLFVPTVDSWWLKKNKKEFEMSVNGSRLYPCGYEIQICNTTKDGKSQACFALTNSAITLHHVNDTCFTASGNLSSFPFHPTSTWVGRLVFGIDNRVESAQHPIAMSGFIFTPLKVVLSVVPAFGGILLILLVCGLIVLVVRNKRKGEEYVPLLNDVEGINTDDRVRTEDQSDYGTLN
ncbi:hypothetical protein BLNAU_14374 [Blattamonas nauphoetae]|uniref:Uncharacterized protein n=1 Tax=Blattamonas nauphoetae TaxID=2049346 RepID=A0ABQ9XHC7_9EUKA|nr:hypothetical protein BLNAU_14374 [Blattamonas nauphoetae]